MSHTRLRRALLTLALVLAAVPAANAQTGAGLRVHVTAAPAADATTVDLVVTDAASPYRHAARIAAGTTTWIGDLAPGVYDVSAAAANVAPAEARVEVQPAHVTIVEIQLVPGTAPRLLVRGSVRTGQGSDFDARALADLPAAGDLSALVETAAPFVIVDRMDTGGLGLGRTGVMAAGGESWAATEVVVDGHAARLPTTSGRLPIVVDMNAVSALSASSGLAPVDVGTPGLRIDLVTRRPGRAWEGGLEAAFTAPGMVGRNDLPHAPSIARIDRWRQGGVFAGGPLAANTGLFVAAGVTDAGHVERDRPEELESSASTLTANLVVQPVAGRQWRVLAAAGRAAYPFDHRFQFLDPVVDERAGSGRIRIAWDRVGESGSRQSVSAGLQRGTWRPGVEDGRAGGALDRVRHAVVPAPPADITQMQWDANVELGAPVRTAVRGAHEWRGGLTFRRTVADQTVIALPSVAETVAGLPARIWMPVAPDASSRRTVDEAALFVADRMAFGPSVSVEAGVRIEALRGGARGAAQGISWARVLPRLSFQWSPGPVALFGGYGRHVGGHAVSLLSFGDPGEATWNVSRWQDANGNMLFDSAEAGVLVAREGRGPGVSSIDPDLKPVHTAEWTIGAEVRPGRHSVLRGAIVIRRQGDLPGAIDSGVPFSDYRLFHVPDINADEGSPDDDQLLPVYERLPESFGRDALVLTNPTGARVAHDAIELSYELRSERWFVMFGASAYRTEGLGGALGHDPDENDPLVLGDRYSNPNAADDLPGRLFFDRAYVGKVSAGWRAPGDVRVATTTRYQDGQPFTRFVVVPNLAGGPEIVHAYPVGRTRFTYTATVDLRIEKGIALGSRRAAVRLDVFNLTNHANEVEEHVLSGPDFRLSSAVQPPRALRLGVRVEF